MKIDAEPRLPQTDSVPALRGRLHEVLRQVALAANGHDNGYIGASVSITAAYTVQRGDSIILADATGGAITLTLQAAGEHQGKVLSVRKIDGGANAVTLTPPAGNIDGAGTLALTAAAPRAMVVSNGTNFYTV